MGHYLVFTSGSCAGFEVPLQDNQEVFIGKDPALCSVVIDKQYKTVSRKHVGVRYSPEYDMFIVVDYSTNGTFVVGGSQLVRNEESYLNEGESVNLGKTENTFRLETRNEGAAVGGAGETVPFGDQGYQQFPPQPDPYAQDPNAMGGGYAQTPRRVFKTDRSWVKIFLLSLVTFGIYGLIFYGNASEELNTIASPYDGKKTMNYYLVVFVLNPITLGIFGIVWNHQFAARIGAEAARRGTNIQFGASDYWLWNVLGTLFIAGPFIYLKKLVDAINAINADYNMRG